MTNKRDYYSIFGLARDASAEDIRQAYFDAARRLHPDTNTAPGETELFLGAQQAYEVLSNPQKRAEYDLTLPPEKHSDFPLDHRLILSRQSLAQMEEPQLLYAILEVSPPSSLHASPSPSMNLCLVIDRSTSMGGSNMDVVKATAIQIMRMMKPQDIFSVVAFSDRAETVIPATRSEDSSKLEARIQMLQTSGGTEIFPGLEMGYNEIFHNLASAKVNHIILLTDGRTYGDEDQCISLARHAADKGIGISGFGIGTEWNDNFLDTLASSTGGTSMYISRPQDIKKALLEKFSSLGRTYAEETRLEFHVPEGIELRYAFRLQPELGVLAFESPMVLGPVIFDTNLRVLMEFVVSPDLLQKGVVTILDGMLHVTLADEIYPIRPLPLHIERSVGGESESDIPPSEIVDALSRLKLYRLQEQARIEVTDGDYDLASEHLHRLATHLLSQGERGLARTALVEAEHIIQNKSFSQEGRKEIKYGTRALLMSGRRPGDK